jgi:putative flippase GtrA
MISLLKNKNIVLILKYFVVGGLSALVDLSLFYVLVKQFDFNYILVSIVGFIIATTVNYLLSIRFVFKSESKSGSWNEFFKTFLVSLFAFAFHLFFLYVFVEVYNIDKMFAKIAAIFFTFMINFTGRKYLVFNKKRKKH